MTRFHADDHLPADEIDCRYKTCPNTREKTRWQIVWLLTRPGGPRSASGVAPVVGLTPTGARAVVRRWNAHAPDGSADRRRGNGPAGTPTSVPQAELYPALQVESPGGRPWTGPEVARYVRDRRGVGVVPRTGWRWPNDVGFSLRVPRPRHPKAATPEQQRVWLRPPRHDRRRPSGGPPRQGRRGVGRGRGPARAQAGRPPGVVPQGAPPEVQRAVQVRVPVRVRARPPGHRPGPHPDPAEGERRHDGGRPGRLRRAGRSRRSEGAGGGRG